MFRTYYLDQDEHWVKIISLVEFAYNNSYHSTIKMVPFEALYSKPFRSLICWEEVDGGNFFTVD